MTTRLAALLLPLLLLAAAGCDSITGPAPDAVLIRVYNNSDHHFEQVTVDGVSYGAVPRGSASAFLPHREALRVAVVKVTVRGQDLWMAAIDHVGETPLPDGRYTFMVSVAEVEGKLYPHRHFVEGARLPFGPQVPGLRRVRSVHHHLDHVAAARGHGGGYALSWSWVKSTYLNPTVSAVPGSRVIYLPDAAIGVQRVRRMLAEAGPDGALRWSRTVWEGGDRTVHAVASTHDGGYLLAGDATAVDTLPDGSLKGRTESWLVRTDARGGEIWSRRFGAGAYQPALAVRGLGGGEWVMAGRGGSGAFAARGDAEGRELWRRSISSPTGAETVHPTPDGGYLLAGDRFGMLIEKPSGWVARTDASGRELWSVRVHGSVLAVLPTADGGAVAAGEAFPYAGGQTVRVSASGKVEEVRSYRAAMESVHDLAALPEGGYLLAGVRGAGVGVASVDAAHAVRWSRTYGSPVGSDPVRSAAVFPAADGITLVAASDTRIWMTRTGPEGVPAWSRVVVQP